jgi:hypothetical protein
MRRLLTYSIFFIVHFALSILLLLGRNYLFMMAFFMEERSPILGPVVVVLGYALLLPILALGNWIHLPLELNHPTTYIALGIHSLFYGSAAAFVWRWLRKRRRRVRIGA